MLPSIVFIFFYIAQLLYCVAYALFASLYENTYFYSDIYKNILHHASIKQNPPIGVVELNRLLLVNAV